MFRNFASVSPVLFLFVACGHFDAKSHGAGYILLSASGGPDADQTTVAVVDDEGTTVAPGALIVAAPSGSTLAEGGVNIVLDLVLDREPIASVQVSLAFDDSQIQVDGGPSPALFTFTPGNGTITQSATLSAVDDAVVEGPALATENIAFSISSADSGFDGAATSPGVVSVVDNDHDLRVFVTATTYQGDFTGEDPDWRVAADARCNRDAAKPASPATAVFKAMMSGGTTNVRRACDMPVPGCTGATAIDWVLKSNRNYTRADYSALFSTDADAIVDNFPAPSLTMPGVTGAADEYWTGLDGAWEPSGFNCQDWSNGTPSAISSSGLGNVDDTRWTERSFGSWSQCQEFKSILCVEQ